MTDEEALEKKLFKLLRDHLLIEAETSGGGSYVEVKVKLSWKSDSDSPKKLIDHTSFMIPLEC